MSFISKGVSCMHLADTNCSIDMEDSDRQERITPRNKGKKRVGRYSFYLKNLIGSGYSSKVYKGIRDNIKGTWYAIKVIKIRDMNVANIYLLNNEIEIIQKLDHPNLVKFVDVHYSNNHCYLITEYCDGGNLQKYAKQNDSLEWGTIIHQIVQGCQYLSENRIVHRDLKPANIFMKDGIWKIGDFGFSKRIPNANSLIIESYKVGSPLFMPLQTLERNMYSAKSDSFALGVIMYYLIFKQYPWTGSNMQKLITNYREKPIDCSRMEFLPIQITTLIKGLCSIDMKERLSIDSCDASVFLTQKSIDEIESCLYSFKNRITEQVVLCQFINYLMKNSMHFLEDNHILYSLMSNNLHHLTSIFKWDDNRSLKEMKNEYILPEGNVRVNDHNYRKILTAIASTINILKFRKDSVLCQVGLEKFLEYYQIVKCLLRADFQGLTAILKSLVLHKNYHDLIPNTGRISVLLLQFNNNL